MVALVDEPALVVAGVALWGLGASLGFPVAISIAGDDPDRPAQRVGAVATAGYLAFLVGPPSLGILGEHYGLRTAILAVVVLLVVGALASIARARSVVRAGAIDAGDQQHQDDEQQDQHNSSEQAQREPAGSA